MRLQILCLIVASLAATASAQDASKPPVDQLVPWLLREDQELREVRLKAEFQGSNRDIYRPEAIVATSGK